jgi:hypothetical protein
MLHGYIHINWNLQLYAILFADDLALTESSVDGLQHSVHILQIAACKYNMEINIEKTIITAFVEMILYQANYVYKIN